MKHIVFAFLVLTASASALSLEKGKSFPDLALKSLDGKQTTAAEAISNNKLTLVEFWASWCSVCKKSFPYLNDISKKYADQGFSVIGINTDDDTSDLSEVHDFLKDAPASFPILYGNTPAIYEKTGINGVPSAALVDQNGKVLAYYQSMRKKEKKQLEKDLATYLK